MLLVKPATDGEGQSLLGVPHFETPHGWLFCLYGYPALAIVQGNQKEHRRSRIPSNSHRLRGSSNPRTDGLEALQRFFEHLFFSTVPDALAELRLDVETRCDGGRVAFGPINGAEKHLSHGIPFLDVSPT